MSLFKRKPKESLSAIGRIIDQPMKDFKKTLEKEKTNIGTMNNLIHYLNGAYADLRQRKDTIMKPLDNEDLTAKERKDIEKAFTHLIVDELSVEELIKKGLILLTKK